MSKLAFNTKTIYTVFQSIKNSLIILLMQGDLDEKFASLNVLYHFSFDDVINEVLRESENVCKMIEAIIIESDPINTNLALCLKHLLNVHKSLQEYENEEKAAFDINSNERIIICSSFYDELVCLKLKNELAQKGLDAEIIQILSQEKTFQYKDLESIRKLIEKCDKFIACISTETNNAYINNLKIFYAKKYSKKIVPFVYKDLVIDNTNYFLRDTLNLTPNLFKVKRSDSIEEIIDNKFIRVNFIAND